jgi:competence protein ComEC
VTGWLLPGLATALWLGLLVRPLVGERAPVVVWMLATAVAFGAAVGCAPRIVATDALQPLVSAPEDARLVDSVAPSRLRRRVAPSWLVGALALVGAFTLGVGWGSAHIHRIEGAFLARVAPASVSVDASLRTDPKVDGERWSAVVDVSFVESERAAARVRESVWVDGRGEVPNAVRGDRVRLVGRAVVPDDAEFAGFLSSRGLVAELQVDSATRLGPSSVAVVRWAQSFRALVGGSIRELFPPREAGLLLGLTLGDDSLLDPEVERDFRASGLSHLLVVSGGNVAMVLAPMLALAAALKLSRWPKFALGVGTVVFFVVLTGAEPSVLRAGVMAGLTLFGVVLGRPRSAASILSAAVFFLLVVDPALVWSVGFQLSVAATAGMVALATPLADRVPVVPKPIALAAGATVAAQIGVTPVLLYHFNEVPTSTLFANVLAFAPVAPGLLLGLVAAFVAIVWSSLGRVLAAIALLPLRYLEILADHAARAPAPWITGGGMATLVLGLLFAAAIAWWIRSGRRLPRSVMVAGLILAPLLVWSTALSSGPPSGLTVRFFDVGQGDAALLTSPAGVTMLVDGGPDEAQVATKLAALGVKRLDVVVASHPHADHVVGLPAVLARVPVGLLIEPGCADDSPDGEALADAISDEGAPVRHPRAGREFVVEDVVVEVLSPDRCWKGTESDANNDAIVLRASVGEDTVLFATEPEEPAQQVMLDDSVDLRADVLKVPHHGAATSLEEFLLGVDAELAVVSVGPNTYGHPVPEVLEWLRDGGAEVFRTDQAGDITVSFSPSGPLVQFAA